MHSSAVVALPLSDQPRKLYPSRVATTAIASPTGVVMSVLSA